MAGIVINSAQNVDWTNMSSFTQFITNANASGMNYLFTAIDFMVFLVLLISLAGVFGWESAILSAGFIGIVLSVLFVYMGVMAMSVAGIFVGALIVIIMYVIWSNRYD